MKLTIIIPVYNEEKTIGAVIQKVMCQSLPAQIISREVVAVDDGSIDGTAGILKGLLREYPGRLVVLTHDKNQGKGAAIASAVAQVSGDVVIIQDADFEYDPADYLLLLEPVVSGRADVVYGSRFTGQQAKRVLYFWHYLGN
ncbi:MAG: glycosyltransferase family 2 protein, partial [Candidatus Omnitrophota bacterium]